MKVNSVFINNETIDRCEGQKYKNYNKSGIYLDTFQTIHGCDSIAITNLTYRPIYNDTLQISICEGQSYKGYSKAGLFSDTLQSIFGCDSIQNFNISIANSKVETISKSFVKVICILVILQLVSIQILLIYPMDAIVFVY